MECSLAKPQADQKSVAGPASQEAGLLPTYPLRVGYGMPGGVYGSLAPGFAPAGFAQVRNIAFILDINLVLYVIFDLACHQC